MNLAGIDIVFAVLILIMALRSGFRGFIREFMSMAALLLGLGVAVLFSGQTAVLVNEYLDAQAWSQVIAFLALFVLVYLFVKIFESALNRLVERINLANLDHALGFFLGVAEGLLLVFVLLLVLQIQPFVNPDTIVRNSVFAEALLPFLPYASRLLGG
ncbi:MAG: CvpA family protein [Spirochaetaceae bacterium]|nr:MAG: CvpA family protein [Spirochaetaceae bacterium]